MLDKLSKRKSVLMMIALLFSTLGMCGDTVIIPGADQMLKAFQNDTFVNFLLSGPNIISMFASIIAGKVLQHMDSKKMLLLGMVLFFIGGTFGATVDSGPFMIAMRCLVGLALGFTNVTAMTIITTSYIDENRRSRMIGIINAGMFCSASLLTALSGMLAQAYGFKTMFYLYASGLIAILLIIFFVPKCPPATLATESDTSAEGIQETESGKKGWGMRFVIMCIGYLIFQITYAAMAFYSSVYADEKGLGGAAFAGSLASAMFISALVASIAFGFLYPRMKRATILISFVFMVIGYSLFVFVPHPAAAVIGCLLLGYSNANSLSLVVMRAGVMAPRSKASVAVSIVLAVMGVGFFLSTYFIQIVKAAMNVETFVGILPVILIINVALLIVGAIYIFATNKKTVATEKQSA